MNIVAISDIHGNFYYLGKFIKEVEKDKIDLILVAGDITDFGDIDEAREILSILSTITPSLFYVTGNCDPPETLKHGISNFEEECVHGKIVKYKHLIIGGVGGSPPTPFNTPSELSEEEIEDILKSISKEWEIYNHENYLRILLTHTPPINTTVDKTFLGEHVGSLAVRRLIEYSNHIELCICGHVHEARGIEKLKNCIIVNPGSLKQGFYAKIKIEEIKEIKVSLKRCI